MRTSCALAASLLAVLAVGCGGEKKQAVDEAPLREALVEYLRLGSMDMKPDEFKSVEVKGDTVTAKVRMATKDDLYGMKPVWTVRFREAEGRWEVVKVDR